MVEFLDSYQEEVVEVRNFNLTKPITQKNEEKALAPASLRISTENEREKLFRHRSEPSFELMKFH